MGFTIANAAVVKTKDWAGEEPADGDLFFFFFLETNVGKVGGLVVFLTGFKETINAAKVKTRNED